MPAEKPLPDYLINTKADKAIGLRLPLELYTRVHERAEDNYRTFNSMVVALLYDSIDRPETEAMFLRLYRKLLEMEKKLTQALSLKKDQSNNS